ncbi:Phenoxybenzoate dioxygenase subunit alpha [Pigmentiphaga humi]|uniref:Phenoxybenzoate dioxygenase subunit alpha n=1 Tax=Pigmentiphaga humi TaxID=2478468 RepID=A0A3P4B139_9BURK|nr:aromatic ring-hydroxylating dioxygenase subunit alpha [Pigmentiphaga humi]VCU68855.1 Phenoxybenzoate dioxygenase subunit alpha [Pigmentiphaga humi]
MLSEEKNRALTQVGADTPGGELLRRYWHPIGAVDQLASDPVRPVRLLGEDLVLYRDLGGNYGLLARHCSHRNADLAYGFVEERGLRCNYHGWQFDHEGKGVHFPYEDMVDADSKLRNKIRHTAYPVRAKGGLLWAYLGPQPAPELPDWEPFSWNNGFVQIVFADVPCNWVQAQENSIDPVHFEWMHANWSRRLRGDTGPYAPAHTKLHFEEFDFGFVYKRVREDTDESHPLWTVGRVCLWPHGFFLGDHFEWRVPVDDENTLSVTWSFIRVPNEAEPYRQETIPSWQSPIVDAKTGRWICSHVINQDIVAWVGQGRITNRSHENLGASDRGVALIRRRLFEDMDRVARGQDPKGVIRDPALNRRIELPMSERELMLNGMPLEQYERHPVWGKHLHHFPFHAGQPDHIKRAYEDAMGLKTVEVGIVNI